MTAPPPLSIGLPVYNGERYLAAAIQSLLDQDFGDFELFISDNASEDRTPDIARAFAATDKRIRYERLDQNLGASVNHNRVFQAARSPFFKWAAHDDICGPGFLRACMDGLADEPEAVLCHGQSVMIDAWGHPLGVVNTETAADQNQPHRRFRHMITSPHMCILVFGVIRREVMSRTALLAPYVGSDRTLLAELSLQGKLIVRENVRFFRRAHPESSIHKHVDEAERLHWFDPSLRGRSRTPTWRRGRAYAEAILRARISPLEKLRAFGELVQWPAARHHTGPRVARLLLNEALGRGSM
ncbi:MAG: glycosyltransferase family 2 protein [Pseudomonadota bacterium]